MQRFLGHRIFGFSLLFTLLRRSGSSREQTMLVLDVIGKMCADVFTDNSVGDSMGVNIFEMHLNVSPNFKQQVGCRAQTAPLLKQNKGVHRNF